MMSRPTARCVCVLLALSAALGACSLPTDQGVTPIDADGLPPEIANTTTTSTTTTTTTTPPPPTSQPPVTTPPTSPPPPTTAAPGNVVPVEIYYADRANPDFMQRLQRQLLEPVSLQSVISQLEQPPDDLALYGVRTAVEPGLIAFTDLERGVLTVSLSGAVFDAMSDDQKRSAIAQMVLTFASFTVPGEGNIGSVIIQVDGAPIPVFNPGIGTTVDAGTPLVFDDFATLALATTGTTTTTALPETTVPPTQTTAPVTGPNQ